MKSKELKAGREAASKELIKSEVMTFRMPSDELERLYELAERMNVRVTVMVRDWVLERLASETGDAGQSIVIPDWEIKEIKERLAVVEQKLLYKNRKVNAVVRESPPDYPKGRTRKGSTKKRAKAK